MTAPWVGGRTGGVRLGAGPLCSGGGAGGGQEPRHPPGWRRTLLGGLHHGRDQMVPVATVDVVTMGGGGVRMLGPQGLFRDLEDSLDQRQGPLVTPGLI
jgi:hypothetical protein